MVKEIIDTRRFTGVWHGQVIKCSSFPDTSNLVVGQSVVVTQICKSSEYFTWTGGETLWFSPGLVHEGGVYRGELWKLTGTIPVYVLSVDIDEFITHLFWSNIDQNLYMCTWADVNTGSVAGETRIYRIDMQAGTAVQVALWSGIPGLFDRKQADPVVDAAEFGSYIYTYSSAAHLGGNVRRFDPITGSWVGVLNFILDKGSFGFGGGIAVDPDVNNNPQVPKLIASDGNNVYVSTDGTTWSFEQNLVVFNSDDNLALFTHRLGDDNIYGAQQFPNSASPATDMVKRFTGGGWVAELDDGSFPDDGFASFTQEFSGLTVSALWAQRLNYNGWPGGCPIWRKPVGGGWVQDWPGPPYDPGPPIIPAAEEYYGIYSQGIAWCNRKIYALFFGRNNDPPDFTYNSSLWRRDALNKWVQLSHVAGDPTAIFWDIQIIQTFYPATGMCVAPRTAWLCHET